MWWSMLAQRRLAPARRCQASPARDSSGAIGGDNQIITDVGSRRIGLRRRQGKPWKRGGTGVNQANATRLPGLLQPWPAAGQRADGIAVRSHMGNDEDRGLAFSMARTGSRDSLVRTGCSPPLSACQRDVQTVKTDRWLLPRSTSVGGSQW